MPYQSPKDVLDMFLAGLRGWAGEPLASCVFRKGAQRSLRLTAAQESACIVELQGLADGEQSAGSGNMWWNFWEFRVRLLVVDDEENPEASEDTRMDLLEQFGLFMHDNRTLVAGAKVGHISEARLVFGQFDADPAQVYRVAETVVTYRTLRS